MFNSKVKKLYSELGTLSKVAISKKWINIIFYSTWAFVVIGIIVMICGLSINSLNQQTRLAIGLSGVGISFLALIVYYTYEYIRRRTLLKLNQKFNFISLYNEELKQEKIIDTNILSLDQLKVEYSMLHARYASMISPNINVMKRFGIYDLRKQNKSFIFSYFETNELGYKRNVNNYMQIIFKKEIKTKTNYQFFITTKNNFCSGNHGYMNKTTHETFDIYFNNEKDLKEAKSLIKKLNKKITDLRIDLQVDNNNLLIFARRNICYLLLDISFFKFYKYDLELLFKNVDKDLDNFINICKFIEAYN